MRVWAVFHPRRAALRVIWQSAALLGVALTLALTLRGGRGWIGPWPGTAGLGALLSGGTAQTAAGAPAGRLLLLPTSASGAAPAVRVYVDGLEVGALSSGPLAVTVHSGDVIALRSLAATPVGVRLYQGSADLRLPPQTLWTVPPHGALSLPPVRLVGTPSAG